MYHSIACAASVLSSSFVFPQTRILVTHGVSFLPQVDEIVVLVDGQVSEIGSYKTLKANGGAFSEFLHTYAMEHNSQVHTQPGWCSHGTVSQARNDIRIFTVDEQACVLGRCFQVDEETGTADSSLKEGAAPPPLLLPLQ